MFVQSYCGKRLLLRSEDQQELLFSECSFDRVFSLHSIRGIFVGIHDDGQTVFITCYIRRPRAKLNYSIYPLSSVVINLVL